jgi:uncharacterized membrane protein YhiD involved in acid resistance
MALVIIRASGACSPPLRTYRRTVAAIGLALGGRLYIAASASTVIILLILVGIKPLEEAYRSRNQSCMLQVEVDNNSLIPELLRATLSLRAGQVKRFRSKAAVRTAAISFRFC